METEGEKYLLGEDCADCGSVNFFAVELEYGVEIACEDCDFSEILPSMIEVHENYFVIPSEPT